MSQHPEFLDLCAETALGTLGAADESRLQKHVADCVACAQALGEFREVGALMGASVPGILPHPRIKAKVLASIAPVPRALPESSAVRETRASLFPNWASWGLAVAVVLLVASNALMWRQSARFQSERNALVEQLATLQDRMEDSSRWLAVATSPESRYAKLDPTPGATTDVTGWFTLEQTTGDAIVVMRNATAPTQQDYELWALLPSGPTSLGVIRPDAQGVAVLQIPNLDQAADIQGLAVSLEPQGGSPLVTPTGPVVLVGQIGG